MESLPHRYNVRVTAGETYPVQITSHGLNRLLTAPPAEFDGPGNLWSPETLTVAAVADCFALTFRAIASAAKLKWTTFVCDATGTLDRADGVIRFTAIQLQARLTVPAADEVDKAHRLLEKAEKGCLVGNSLKFTPTLNAEVTVEEPAFAV